MGVDSHCHAHFPEKVKVSTPTNSGIAETIGSPFIAEERAFTSYSRSRDG